MSKILFSPKIIYVGDFSHNDKSQQVALCVLTSLFHIGLPLWTVTILEVTNPALFLMKKRRKEQEDQTLSPLVSS